MTTQTVVSRPRAADALVSVIEQQIQNGELASCDPLPPEREIVRDHGVSRTVVREAVRILASKGLISTKLGFRPVVAQLGYDSAIGAVGSVVTQLLGQPGGVRNLFELRIRMEASLVRDAAQIAEADQIRTLETALAANRLAIPESAKFYDTDVAFHSVLYEIPKNPVLPAIHRAYTDWLSQHWIKMPRLPDRNQINFEAHQAIFDAILRRDPDRAEEALRAHLKYAWKQVSSTFGELDP